jgi:hypothetical protein
MRVEDLLGKGEGAIEALADNGKVLRHLGVVDVVALLPVVLPRQVVALGHLGQQAACR